MLQRVIPHERVASAFDLYRVRVGEARPEVLMDRIRRVCNTREAKFIAPLHVRYHWTTAVFTSARGGGLRAVVFDSAPSSVTAEDIHHLLLSKMGVSSVRIICPGRQPRGSMECGVHAVVNAWRAWYGHPEVVTAGELSLEHLRGIFAHLARNVEQVEEYARRVAADPTARICKVPQQAAGGAPGAEERNVEKHAAQRRDVAGEAAADVVPDAPSVAAVREAAAALQTSRDASHPRKQLSALAEPFTPAEQLRGGAARASRPLSEYTAEQRKRLAKGVDDLAPPRADESVGSRNLCYLDAATRILDLASGRQQAARTTVQLWRLQARLGHVHGEQNDAADTVAQLVASCDEWRGTSVLWCTGAPVSLGAPPTLQGFVSEIGGEIIPHLRQDRSYVVLDNAALFECPGTHAVAAAVDFMGAVSVGKNTGAPSAPAGHYEVRTSAAQVVGQLTVAVVRPRLPAPDPRTARALGKSAEQLAAELHEGQRLQQQRLQRRRQSSTYMEPVRPVAEEDSPADDPLRMQRRQVKEALATLRAGQYVRVHWSREEADVGDVEAGVWLGRVEGTAPKPYIAFTHEVCPDCNAPRAFDEAVRMDLPRPRTIYYDIAVSTGPQLAACVCELGDPDDERPYETGLHESQRVVDLAEGACLVSRGSEASASTLRGDAGVRWHIFHGRPPHVHELVWRRYAASTRAQHIKWLLKIRGMHAELRTKAFSVAVVELVLRLARARRWCWSTVASALSSCATALAQLNTYTSEPLPIDVRADNYFAQATQRAQTLARTTTGTSALSSGMSQQQLDLLTGSRGIKAPGPRLLLLMSWHFAARVGDMRQVRPADIIVRRGEDRADGAVPVLVTFRFGKGVAFGGPYTVHAMVPRRVAGELTAAIGVAPAHEALFSLRDQAALSAAVGDLVEGTGRLNLRSVRRGRIMAAAADGVDDEELMLLSGHKSRDTLMRYLGWGVASSSMRQAALRRHDAAVPRGAGVDLPAMPRAEQPPKMGRFSGYTGARGRRVEARPAFFPRQAPSYEACGVRRPAEDVSGYPLHIKQTSRVDWSAAHRLAEGTPLADAMMKAEAWCTSDALYGPPLNADPKKVPYADFTEDQLRELVAADKIRPHHGPIHAFVNAFTIAQHAKRRLRVIAEPVINATCCRGEMYAAHYPTRLERRARARDAKFSVEFDFAAFFDQFELPERVRGWFVLRSRQPVDGHQLFALTRLPMGATFAPSVAQTVTSTLVFPLLAMEHVCVDTMIDNVRIVATRAGAFIKAVRTFLCNVQAARITLNDAAEWEGLTDNQLLDRCAVKEDVPRVFLGERYLGGTVSNTDALLEKLRAAIDRFRGRAEAEDSEASQYSKRNFASLVGLMLFMAHTVNVPLTGLHTLLRAYGNIISATSSWDAPCEITSEEVNRQVCALAEHLLKNEAVLLPDLRQPELDAAAYDAVIEVDASLTAWGARVWLPREGRAFELQQRWAANVSHSAHAEPRAARCALRWLRSQQGYERARVAVVTDHIAMVVGQRRWYANFGGFSRGFFLNSFFHELYTCGGGEVFHVDGIRNQADALSRDPSASQRLVVRSSDAVCRDLQSVAHPYRFLPRLHYQV